MRWLFRTSLFQADLGLLCVRVFFGLTLAIGHGLDKVSNFERFNLAVDKLGIPFPQVLGSLAGLSEFLGGILLAVGFLSRGAAAAIGTVMIVAAFFVHIEDPFLCTSMPCKELALCYGVAALGLFLAGPGRLSVDYALLGRRGSKPAAPSPPYGGLPVMPPISPGAGSPERDGSTRGASFASGSSSPPVPSRAPRGAPALPSAGGTKDPSSK